MIQALSARSANAALRTLLAAASCAPCWLFLACNEPPAPAPASAVRLTVLVTLDTTRADRIGCYGYASAETPHLDALARRGTRFARAYAPVPLTVPSHATLFTGLLPPRHGVRVNGDQRLSGEALTLAEQLQQAGWRTHAAVSAFVTQGHWGFDQGFDGYDDSLGVPSDRLSWRAERSATATTDDALAALEAGAQFLWVHYFEPHAPYRPPEPFAERHEQPYDAEIAAMDAQLGRLLSALPKEALIVVVGDHGEALGEGGEQQHGLLLNDATLHVPLIMAGPDVPPGVVERPVSLADITPTLLGMLGLRGAENLDGSDLFAPAARAGVYAESRYGLHHYGWAPLSALIGARGRLVRGARDELEGQPPEHALEELERLAAGTPSWEAAPLTLDLAQVEQLQSLGYLASPEPAAVSGDQIDPRDGIHDMQRLGELQALPPGEQEAALRELLDELPQLRDARFRLGLLLAQRGRLQEALAQIASAYDHAPDSTTAATMGELWLQADDPAESLHWFREAAALDSRSLTAHAGAVEALVNLGRLDEALAEADAALEDAPDHGRLLAVRALLGLAQGQPPDPWLEPVTRIARQRPYEPRLLLVAARLQAEAGDVEEAISLYRQELRWRPQNTLARLELYGLFRQLRRLVDALKTLRPLLALHPAEARWQGLAAECYLAMDRPDLAAPHLERCAGHPLCPEGGSSSP